MLLLFAPFAFLRNIYEDPSALSPTSRMYYSGNWCSWKISFIWPRPILLLPFSCSDMHRNISSFFCYLLSLKCLKYCSKCINFSSDARKGLYLNGKGNPFRNYSETS
jgi:hypothetical protein